MSGIEIDGDVPGAGLPAAVIEGFHLSAQQRRIWLLRQNGSAYVCQCAVQVEDTGRIGDVAAALHSAAARHEILRTTYRCLPGMELPVQVIGEEPSLSFRVLPLDGGPLEPAVESVLREDRSSAFDFENGPLVRLTLLAGGGPRGVLLITLPAISSDPESLKNIVCELFCPEAAPNGEPVQYADFSEWQSGLLEESVGGDARAYWADSLRRLPVLPAGREGPRSADSEPRSFPVELEAALSGGAGRAHGAVPPSLVLLAAWHALLARLTGETDFSLGALFDGRSFDQLRGALGPFARYLPVRCSVAEDLTFEDLLDILRVALLESQERQNLFTWGDERPEGAAGFPIAFDFTDWSGAEEDAGFRLLHHYVLCERSDLRLSCVRSQKGLRGEILENGSAFGEAVARLLPARLTALLRSAAEDPRLPFWALDILGAEERRQILFGWNATTRGTARPAGLMERFREQVVRMPEMPALEWAGRSLSFRELDRRTDLLAWRLLTAGVEPRSVVGLLIGRGGGQVVGLLAILKAGSAYLPLDPHQPPQRLSAILEDAEAAAVLGDPRFRGGVATPLPWIELGPDGDVAADGESAAPVAVAVDPDDLAYVIFTSGSTGRPKGVMIRRGAVASLLEALRSRCYGGLGEGLRVSLNAPLSFDASVKQWVQLLAGNCLVVVPEEVRPDGAAMLSFLLENRVEVLDCTPSQLHLLLDAGLDSATSVRLVLLGGEAVTPGLWRRLAAWPGVRCLNVYGPTECTVDTTAHPVEGSADPVLGRPLDNVRVYVMDRQMQPAPVAMAGELWIGGEGLARGYLARPELTAERFVPDPFGPGAGARLYRSGDLVRWSPEGYLEFLGRVDHQVKVRGHRIELGEIEACLRQHPGVDAAVVVLRLDRADRPRLVGYAVPRRQAARQIEGRLRRELPNGLAVVEQNRNETDYLYQEIFVKESYTRHGVRLADGSCVLDVGANIGVFSLFVSQRCPTARIYAFEPIGPIHETLRINCELYAPGARLFPFGLSCEERTEAFLYYPRYSMMSGQKDYAHPEEEVEVIKRYLSNEGVASSQLLSHAEELLDGRFEGEVWHARLRRLSDIIREEGIVRVDLLKVDVQRAEMDVLLGIDPDDWPRIGQVVLEVHDARGGDTDGRTGQIAALLAAHGFSVTIEQDELLVGTDRYQLYAVRPGWEPGEAVQPAAPARAAVLTPAELRDYLRNLLPDYMLPAAVLLLDELPLTRHGKVDRAALPAPEEQEEAAARKVAGPRNPFEEILAGIWSELLGVEQIGVDESFFDLGGHSLLATQLVSRVREHFQIELSLRSFFEGPTLEQLAVRLEEAIRAGRIPDVPPLRPAPRTGDLPLSFAQQRLWLLHQLESASALYNNPYSIRIEGGLDLRVVAATLTEILRRQEALRTVFVSLDGDPAQRVLPPAPQPVWLLDLADLPHPARDEELRRIFAEAEQQPFDLARGPLLRVWVARLSDADHALLFVQHHIVSDAWSLGILAREVAALYGAFATGSPSPLSDLPIQYADYACWQRSWLRGEALASQLDYWRGQLGSGTAPLALPLDRPRPASPSFRGGVERFALDPLAVGRLRGAGAREGATLFMVLLSAFQALLHRYSGQDDIRVGTPIAGRARLEVEGIIGFFVNTLVLRADLSGPLSFRQLVGQVRGEALGAYAHQDLPFEKLVEELAPDRNPAVSPLFQVMFSLQNVPAEILDLPGLRLSRMPREVHWAPFDLTLVLTESGSAVAGELQYAAELFEPSTVHRLSSHLRSLCESAAAEPETPVAELPLLGPGERRQILEVWSGAGGEAPAGLCLHRLFEVQAEQRPDAPAVVSREQTVTYGELNRSAEALSLWLARLGVGPEVRVALCLPSSPRLATGILAVLKAGGAFVPLDPAYPRERLREISRLTGARVLLTEGDRIADLEGMGTTVLRLDSPLPTIEGGQAPAAPPPEAAAFVFFTSGSTGIPKGVVVSHQSAASYTLDMSRRFGLGPADRFLQFASPAFDVLIEELFPAWAVGAAVAFERREILASPAGLQHTVKDLAVTVMELPAAYWREWVDDLVASGQHPPASLRLLILGSEKPSLDHLEVWQSFAVPVLNIFGLTETTITSNLYPVAPGPLTGRDRVDLAIGPPVAIARVYVLDRRFEPVPPGVVGELYVGGIGVARGYLGRPDLTAERFAPDPLAETPGMRLYHTGDLARLRPDGALEFLGRVDDQVKVRGFRIEPGEVETRLSRHPGVRRAIVTARTDERGERLLVAYFVPEPGAGGAPTAADLRLYLRGLLPDHLVPSRFVPIDTVPMTPNGKVDRRALPAPPRSTEDGDLRERWAPAGPVEEMLALIWAEVLGIERPARDASFFDLGGHSLLAVRVVGRVRRVFQLDLPLRAVFDRPTLADLSAAVESALRAGTEAEAGAIGRAARDANLPLSFAQQRLWFFDQLEPGSPIYNVASKLRIEGPLSLPALQGALRQVVQRHETLRTRFEAVDGRPVQRIGAGACVDLPQVDLAGLPAQQRGAVLRLLAEREARRPFDLSRGPLLRAALLRLGPEDHALLLTLHHIVSDEWSAEILVRETSALYEAACRGLRAELLELPVQYVDFSCWQRQWLQGRVLSGQLDYWLERLRDTPPELPLLLDRPRPPVRSFRGGSIPVRLGPEISGRLRRLAREQGVTPFMALLALFQLLLARWCGQRDVPVGTPVAGRNRMELENLIGFFVNTLVLRTDLAGSRTFRELLGCVREVALGAYAHQDVPFERLVDELSLERELSRNPLFQVFFSLAAHRPAPPEVAGLRLTPLPGGEPPAKFDLELALSDGGEEVRGSLVYAADLFDRATVARLADRLLRLGEGLAASAEADIWDLDLLGEPERHQVLVEWSRPEGAAGFEPVAEAFSRQARRQPDAVALEWEGERLSHGELEKRANRLANHLIANGVGPEAPVGVLLERSPDLVVALLAIFKSGGAYVPLDPELPAERLGTLLEEGAVDRVVSREALAGRLPRTPLQIVLLDAEAKAIEGRSEEPPAVSSRSADLAYQIYTSGTTGRPKAVMVEHGSLSWLLRAARERFGWSAEDRMPCLAASSFDIFLLELLGPLLAGGTSVLFPIRPVPDVERLVAELGRCTALHAVPALMTQIVHEAIAQGGVGGLRAVFVGGDTVSADLLTDLSSAFPGARLWTLYGPTEGTILATSHDASSRREPLLGRPLPGAMVEVIDGLGRPAPIGVAGEICLGGPGVSRGYRGLPGLTAEKYVARLHGRGYRTGDLGRWLGDGSLEFLGRADEQVKVRGFRIEPGEVEAALRRCPGVHQAAVAARPDGSGNKRLVAYLVAGGEPRPDPERTRDHLARYLPDYMVPSTFVTLDELPLTAHGKLDRRRLPAPDAPAASNADDEPRTPSERALARIWREVLGLDRIGIHQSFFALGGDSILSIRVVAKARQLGLHLTPKLVFLHPTIAGLASVAAEAPAVSAEQGEVSGEAPLTPIQQRFLRRELLEPGRFNQSLLLLLQSPLDPGALERAVACLVRHHDALRFRYERRPEGWTQSYSAPGEAPFTQVEFSALPAARRREALEDAAEQVQASLDLALGPVLRFVLFALGAGERQRLLAVIHHLVVDGVSWRILLEDLETAYGQARRGESLALPAKTTSFKSWGERLQEHARSDALAAESEMWIEVASQVVPLPADIPGGRNRVLDEERLTVALSPEETRSLVEQAPRAYRTRPDEILLAALAAPLASFAAARSVVVEIEGHGRDALEGVDLTRTVGWTTAAFPVVVEADCDPGVSLKRVKERLRSPPNAGIGYGLLLDPALQMDAARRLQALPVPQVSFNYLGRLDHALTASSPFGVAPEHKGRNQDPRDSREHVLEISSAVAGGRLEVYWGYSREVYRRETIAALADELFASLRRLLEHCLSAEAGGVTPSDFPLARLGQEALDRLLGSGRGIEDVYPLSPLQQGMLFRTLSSPGSKAYFEQISYRLRGDLDVSVFRRAWQRAVERHPVLRSSFHWEGLDEPLQVVHEAVELPWTEHDWRGVPVGDRHRVLDEATAADRERGFDPTRAPLMRLSLSRLEDGEWWLTWSHHHLLLDGWSLSILFHEVRAGYDAFCRGAEPDLPVPRPYRGYIEWLVSRNAEAEERYWRDLLAGFTAPTPLPSDRPARPGGPAEADAELRGRLPEPETASLAALARQHGTTLQVVVQAAWSLLLARYAGQEDVVFGTVVSGRPPELATDAMVGLFVNTLPIRVSVPARASLSSWLGSLQQLRADLAQQEHAALAEIHGWSEVSPGVPLFESLFVFENYPFDREQQPPSGLTLSEIQAFETVDLPLALTVAPGSELRLRAQYATARFDSTTVLRLIANLEQLLSAIAGSHDLELGELELLSGPERHQVLVEWSAWGESGGGMPVPEELSREAQRRPEALALEWEGERWSYGELESRANRLARHLAAGGVGPEVTVGVLLERSPELVVALLAVLKAGGVFVPLDPELPAERLELLLEEGAVEWVVSRGPLVERLARSPRRLVLLDREAEAVARREDAAPGIRVRASDLAYLIYTSGTTGRPKAVMVEHGSLSWLLRASSNHFGWCAADRVPCLAAFSFDIFLFELMSPLLTGGTSLLFPIRPAPEIPRLVSELFHCTALHAVPALMRQIADEAIARGGVMSLQKVFVGGDAVPAELLRDLRQAFPCARLWVLYGPTEGTILATSHRVPDEGEPLPLLGRPLPGAVVEVLDGIGRPAPIGVAGEIHLGGPGVSRGYFGRPDLTAERFTAGERGRRYRTGDLGRWRGDGSLEFLGRRDEQVKVRGFRVEPGEVEVVLRRCTGIHEAAVVARREAAGDLRLVAYVVAEGKDAQSPERLRGQLAAWLPDYMMPSAFVFLDELPLTPHGKVDRRRLPAPEVSVALDADAAPRTPLEELLAQILSEVLGTAQVGRGDSFFDLGGHSLMATRVVSRVRATLGIELSIRAIFDAPTVAELAAAVERSLQTGALSDAPPLVAVPRSEILPLSFAQQRLWFLDRLEPGSPLYNVPVALQLRGDLDLLALERSFSDLSNRHEALRTTFALSGDEPVQVIARTEQVPLPLIDLSGLMEPGRGQEARRLVEQVVRCPFDLSRGPLVRAAALRVGSEDHVLLVTLHHIVTDGWSMEVLTREMAALYSAHRLGGSPRLPALALQYADFARWQRDRLRGEVLEAELAGWRQRLAGAPPSLELAWDRPRMPAQSGRGALYTFRIPGELSANIEALSRREGVTPFMTLLAAFQLVLSRYSGAEDILVGTPVANRTRVELEGIIGFFVNTLVLRTHLAGAAHFRQLLGRVRETTIDSFHHQELPFEKLVEELNPPRDLGTTPLFQVMLVLQNAPTRQVHLPGLAVVPFEIEGGPARFDLTLVFTRGQEGLRGSLQYRPELFDRITVERFTGHLRALVEAAMAEPGRELSQLAWMQAAERQQLLVEWQPCGDQEPPDSTLHRLLEIQASRNPAAVALVEGERSITYGELNAWSNRLARHLLSLGVGQGERIAVLLPRSAEAVASLVAVLKAGGAYVPLDVSYPPGRLAWILQDSGARILLTRGGAPDWTSAGVRSVDLAASEGWSGQSSRDFPDLASPGSDAYVIYTSGSTGHPKGVQIAHGHVVRLLHATRHWFDFDAADVWTLFHSYSFDFSVWEMWGALSSGGRLVVVPLDTSRSPADFLDLLSRERVTVLNQTPSAFRQLMRADAEHPRELSLRLVIFGGEALDPTGLTPWLERHGDQSPRLVNMYGITETTVHATYRPVSWKDALGGVGSRIGIPLPDLDLYLLDRALEPVPIGVPGEICIGGAGVASGYLGRPDLTAERFIPAPFGPSRGDRPERGRRLYRSGDLARWRSDGDLEYLGRIDQQVKIRGFRIEPGEIEAVLRSHPGVQDAAVLVREEPDDRRLVAYVTMGESCEGRVDMAALRSHARERLPEHMVPALWVALPALPLTANGKLDRRALPAPQAVTGGNTAPSSPVEELLADLWADALGLTEVDLEAGFFDLGGHSMLAARMLSQIRDRFGVDLPLRRLFEGPTVLELARAVQEAMRAAGGVGIEPLRPVPRGGPLPLSFAQQRLWILDQLQPGSPAYNVPGCYRIGGSLCPGVLQASLCELARRHESLRSRFKSAAGEPMLWIDDPRPVPLRMIDLSPLPEGLRAPEARRLAKEEARRPFNLARGPLMRAVLMRLEEGNHLLMLTLHHIVTDGWSLGVLARDLTTIYQGLSHGRSPSLPDLPVQHADFAHWERHRLKGELLDSLLDYWRHELAGPIPPLHLPSDRPRPAHPTHRGAWVKMSLEPDLSAGVRDLARRDGATLFMVLLAAFGVVLRNLARTEQIVVGTNVANRSRNETENLIGFFLNLLVLRMDLSGQPGFRDLLARVRRLTLDAYTHQDLPFDLLVDLLNPERAISDQPLFQVKIDLQHASQAPAEVSGLALEGFELEPEFAHNDLTLHVNDARHRLDLQLLYSVDLFDRPRMVSLLEDLREVLAASVAEPDAGLADLDKRLDAARVRRERERQRGFKDTVRQRLKRRTEPSSPEVEELP